MGNKDIFDYIYVVVPINKLITKTSAKSNNTTTANTMMVKIVFFEVFDGVVIPFLKSLLGTVFLLLAIYFSLTFFEKGKKAG
jgi:hypothetical protein